MGARKESDPAPPEAMDGMSVAAPMGYGPSTLVSECLHEYASKISDVGSACRRVGIAAGPIGSRLGMWNKREYIPSVSGATIRYGKVVN